MESITVEYLFANSIGKIELSDEVFKSMSRFVKETRTGFMLDVKYDMEKDKIKRFVVSNKNNSEIYALIRKDETYRDTYLYGLLCALKADDRNIFEIQKEIIKLFENFFQHNNANATDTKGA